MAQNHKAGQQAGANEGGGSDSAALDPDVLLGIWNNWMKSGTEQLTEHFAHDPMLKSIEQMYNANPLHDVIPLDWAGIAWALRTVWLRSLTRPDMLPAFSELNATVWRSALDIWSEGGAALVRTGELRPSRGGQERRQTLRCAGMAQQRSVPHAEGSLPARLRLAAQARRGGRHGRRRTASAGFPFTPVRRCNEPGAAAGVQPGGAAARLRDGRH